MYEGNSSGCSHGAASGGPTVSRSYPRTGLAGSAYEPGRSDPEHAPGIQLHMKLDPRVRGGWRRRPGLQVPLSQELTRELRITETRGGEKTCLNSRPTAQENLCARREDRSELSTYRTRACDHRTGDPTSCDARTPRVQLRDEETWLVSTQPDVYGSRASQSANFFSYGRAGDCGSPI